MSKLPAHIREDVSRAILKRAGKLNWDDLSNRQKSEIYETWVTDADIGQKLALYIPLERIRVWIKDGPMKEYKRARRGLGPYAGLVPEAKEYEKIICRKVMGAGYRVLEASIDVKPNRFDAESQDEVVTIIWGNAIDLKHMVWAWLTHPNPAHAKLVLVHSLSQPLTPSIRTQTNVVVERLGAEIAFLNI